MTTNWSLVGGAVGGALIAVLGSTLVICYRIGMSRGDIGSPLWEARYWYWRLYSSVQLRWHMRRR